MKSTKTDFKGADFFPRNLSENHLSKAPGCLGFTASSFLDPLSNDATNRTLGKGLPKYTENEKVFCSIKNACLPS